MAPYKTSSPLLALPSAANGVTVTPPGVANGWSDWVEIDTSAATAMRIATLIALPGVRAAGNHYEVELGTGIAGHETPVAAARGYSGNNAGANADASDILHLAIPADVVTQGQRLSVRLRQVSTSTTAWRIALQYWALPMTGHVPAATLGPVNVPAGSSLSVTAGAANVYGAWVEVTPACDGNWAIGNVVCVGPNFSTWELEIGIGSPEVSKWSVRSRSEWFINANAWQGGPWNILLRPTLGAIPAGTRVAVRIRTAAGGETFGVGLTVVKQAVAGASSNLRMLWSDWTTVLSAAGGFPNFSPWTTMIAATSTGITLSGLTKTYPQAGQTGRNMIQIGVGPDGSEVLVAECYVDNAIWGGGRFNFPLPYARFVPAGARVALRISTEYGNGGVGTAFSLSYQEILTVPDFDNWTNALIQQAYVTTSPPVMQPAKPRAGSSAWQNGSWLEIDANVPVSRVITAFEWVWPAAEVEIDIGVGPNGFEEVATTVRGASGSSDSEGGVSHDVLPIPAVIPAGSRLVLRARCSSGGSQTIEFTPHYTAEPVSAPSVESLAHDCDTGIFTLTGQNLLAENATLAIVTRDGTPVGFAVLTQSNSTITFQLTETFVDGTYCVVIASDVGDTDPFCEEFTCESPSCLAVTDDPTPPTPPAVCLPIIDGGWTIVGVETDPAGVSPSSPIVTVAGGLVLASVPLE